MNKRSHFQPKKSPIASQQAKRAGGVIEGNIVLAMVLGVFGIFLLVSGFQASPGDFRRFGAFCYSGVCIHPEWIAIGVGLIAGALFVFFVLRPERKERRP
jgi:hypothetical protein